MRFVQNHKGIGQGASAHEGQRGNFQGIALKCFLYPLKTHQVVQGVIQRAQIGVDFLAQVAGQKTQFFAGFHRRAGEHNALHGAALQCVDGASHGQIGFARACRPNAKGDVVLGDVFQVCALRGRARLQLGAPGQQLHGPVVSLCQAHIAGQHPLHLIGWNGLGGALIQGLQHLQGFADFGLGAVDLELLVPVRDLDLQPQLDGAQMFIHGAAQVAESGVVGRVECVAQNQVDNPLKFLQ